MSKLQEVIESNKAVRAEAQARAIEIKTLIKAKQEELNETSIAAEIKALNAELIDVSNLLYTLREYH